MNAPEILRLAAQTIEDRASERGEVSERSMARTIETFNAHWNTDLTEQQGWSFMQHLKAARNISGYKEDDLIDKVAYSALEAECVINSKVEIPVGSTWTHNKQEQLLEIQEVSTLGLLVKDIHIGGAIVDMSIGFLLDNYTRTY